MSIRQHDKPEGDEHAHRINGEARDKGKLELNLWCVLTRDFSVLPEGVVDGVAHTEAHFGYKLFPSSLRSRSERQLALVVRGTPLYQHNFRQP